MRNCANHYDEKKFPRESAYVCSISGFVGLAVGFSLLFTSSNTLDGKALMILGTIFLAIGVLSLRRLRYDASSETARIVFASCLLALVLLPTLTVAATLIFDTRWK